MDTYTENEHFAGEEAVWGKDTPVYAMNYYGQILGKKFSTVFLKESLALVSCEKPFRRPEFYRKGLYLFLPDTRKL